MNRLLVALATLLLGFLLIRPTLAGDTVYYYSSDTLHSEVVVTDASRNVVERTYYAPYGQVLNRSLRDGPGYTGQDEDPETSLVYMQQRYFDPESGRFVSGDPVATTDDGGSFNRYAYANDNPYLYADPAGLMSVNEFRGDVADILEDVSEQLAAVPPNFDLGAAPILEGLGDLVRGAEAAKAATQDTAATVDLIDSVPKLMPEAAQVGSTVAKGAAAGTVSAVERASQIAKTLGNTQRFVTVSVTDTAEGVRVISSSENALRPAALNALQDGEIAVSGVGHAEVTGINAARDLGLTPIGTAASRPICPVCAQFLQDQGVTPLGPLK